MENSESGDKATKRGDGRARREPTTGARKLVSVLQDKRKERAILAVAPTVEALNDLGPEDLSAIKGVDEKDAERLQATLTLANLPGQALVDAVSFVLQGVGPKDFRDRSAGELRALLARKGLRTPTPASLASWALALTYREARKPVEQPAPFGSGKYAFRPAQSASRRIVLDAACTWEDVAQRFYPKSSTKEVAKSLQELHPQQNGKVLAGARIALPTLDDQEPRAPDLAPIAKDLEAVFPTLSSSAAKALAELGFHSPRALLHMSPAADAAIVGAEPAVLEGVKAAAALAVHPAAGPRVAAAFLQNGAISSIEACGLWTPEILLNKFRYLVGIGALEWKEIPRDRGTILGILETLGAFLGPFWSGQAQQSLCAKHVPVDLPLEELFSVRWRPEAMSALAVEAEVRKRVELRQEIQEALRSGITAAKIGPLKAKVLQACGMTDALFEEWGVAAWGNAASTAAILLKYLEETQHIHELVARLAAAHEAFHRSEFGRAFILYGETQRWFHTSPGDAYRDFITQIEVNGQQTLALNNEYFPNGQPNPEFNPTVMNSVEDYYTKRAAAANRDDLLETLELRFTGITLRSLIIPWLETGEDTPHNGSDPDLRAPAFRALLYHVYHYILPLCRADCLVELGRYCEALEELFRVHYEEVFTDKRVAGEEATLVDAARPVGGGGAAALPASQAGFDPAGYSTYIGRWLNPLEKTVVARRTAQVYLRWADQLFRDGKADHARARYAQVLRIQFTDWNAARTFDAHAEGAQNIAALQDCYYAERQLKKIANGLNFLGYSPTFVPAWPFAFLLNSARYFGSHAAQLERDALQFLASAENEHAALMHLNQSLATARSQAEVERRRVTEADAGADIADANIALRNQQLANNQDHLNEINGLAGAKQALGIVGGVFGGAGQGMAFSGGNGYAAIATAAGGAIIGGVTSYLSGEIELQEARNRNTRERLELTSALAVSQAESLRAEISASIARLTRDIALANVGFAQANLQYAMQKTLNADFWFDMAQRTRRMAQRYLDEAITVAFFAEQVFEFDRERRIDRIKLNYAATQGRLALLTEKLSMWQVS